jgi:hypothetical protein
MLSFKMGSRKHTKPMVKKFGYLVFCPFCSERISSKHVLDSCIYFEPSRSRLRKRCGLNPAVGDVSVLFHSRLPPVDFLLYCEMIRDSFLSFESDDPNVHFLFS